MLFLIQFCFDSELVNLNKTQEKFNHKENWYLVELSCISTHFLAKKLTRKEEFLWRFHRFIYVQKNWFVEWIKGSIQEVGQLWNHVIYGQSREYLLEFCHWLSHEFQSREKLKSTCTKTLKLLYWKSQRRRWQFL